MQRTNPLPFAFLILLPVFALLSLTGCYGYASLRPVRGPEADAQSHPRSLKLKMEIARDSHTMSVTLPDGEVCRGEYVHVRNGTVEPSDQAAAGSSQADLRDAWIDLYGTSYFEKHIAAKPRVQAVLTGNRNTTLKLDMCNGCAPRSPFNEDLYDGVATDNHGNTYHVRF